MKINLFWSLWIYLIYLNCANSQINTNAIEKHEADLANCRNDARIAKDSGLDVSTVWDSYNKCADKADSDYQNQVKK